MTLCRFVEKVAAARASQSDLAAVLAKRERRTSPSRNYGRRMAVRSPIPKVSEHTERHHRAPGDASRLHDRRGQPGKNPIETGPNRGAPTETSDTNLTPAGAVSF
jgi:hypothetical protein